MKQATLISIGPELGGRPLSGLANEAKSKPTSLV
jgi:hypothetical protein